jgi:PKD repeat protein
VTDVKASFVADPFMFHENNVWYMFFEILPVVNWETNGYVGMAKSSDGLHWAYQGVVLHEQFHLSYPLVFKSNRHYYMTPETCATDSIRLYEATNFPYGWTLKTVIASGKSFVDPCILYYGNTWWMFVSDISCNNCYLYYASNLLGPWVQHPGSPVVYANPGAARGGGRPLVCNGKVYRFAQKCDVSYGECVRCFQVDTLTTTVYAEHEIAESPILKGTGQGWNSDSMHQFDAWWTGTNWLGVADGYAGSTRVYSIGMYYGWSRGVAVTSVVPSTLQAVAGTLINISVTVKNEGVMAETFNVTTYHDNNKIGTQTVTSLVPGAVEALTFNWNTNALLPGNYTIRAEASTVPDETDTVDNVYVGGTVRIVKPPVASFTYFPSNPRINEPILFDASSSTPNGGTITNYRWDFDDGNTTSTLNLTITHVYSIARPYNVTLTVIDSESLNASAWNGISVSAPVQTEISIFTYPSSNLVGFKVEINGTLTDFGGKGISDADIIVSYALSGASQWVPLIPARTESEGNYCSWWVPPSMGDFALRAEWVGNQSYAGASKNATLSIISCQDKYVFSVASNSTILALTFNSTSEELKFNATGPSNTTGFARVTMAKTFVANATKLKLYVDEEPLSCSIFSTGDSWVVSFTYAHSTRQVTLILDPYRLYGDVNNDGRVDMLDLSMVAAAFGSRPTDTRWNSTADLDNNRIVNIVDISIVAHQYGKEV